MRKFYFLILILVIILAVVGIYYIVKNWQPAPSEEEPLVSDDTITRKEIIADISERIAEISPVKPVLGGNWYVTRFWFIQGSDKNLYVEYEDGHILRQILIEAKKKEDKLNYEVIGYFEPGETSWNLKKGEDKFFGNLLDLYEYNEELEEWIKRN